MKEEEEKPDYVFFDETVELAKRHLSRDDVLLIQRLLERMLDNSSDPED